MSENKNSTVLDKERAIQLVAGLRNKFWHKEDWASTILGKPNGVPKLDDSTNPKILPAYFPDYIMGQMLFGGTVTGQDVVNPSAKFQSKYGIEDEEFTLSAEMATQFEGVYFLATNTSSVKEGGVLDSLKDADGSNAVQDGDWVVSKGDIWIKIDNTDAVKSVLGQTGNISAEQVRNLGFATGMAEGAMWYANGNNKLVSLNSTSFARTLLGSIAENTMLGGLYAEKAQKDGEGNNIVSTYMPFTGGTFTGRVTFNADATHNAHIILANGMNLVGKANNVDSPNTSLVGINSDNTMLFGYGGLGKYHTNIYGKTINFYTKAGESSAQFDDDKNLTVYGAIAGIGGVSAKGIVDFSEGGSSGGAGGAHYDLVITQNPSSITLQLLGDDGDVDTKTLSAFSTSQSGIVPYAPSTNSLLFGSGWRALQASDIPSLDWSKITSGKPTTLGGYGITDAYTKSQIESGIFPNMRVGLADDLGDIEEPLDVEYTFQPTANPNEIRDGYAQIESLKGNSVVWNQKIEVSQRTFNSNGLSISIDSSGRITVSGIATVDGGRLNYVNNNIITLLPTHKYLFFDEFDGSFDIYLTQYGDSSKYLYMSQYKNRIFTVSETISGMIGFNFLQGHQYNTTSYIQLIDLTQMFSEGYEPTTVEEFERRCPKGMSMDYNEGEVIHFNGDIKSVGFNQWDEEWEVSGNGIKARNLIPVFSNMAYYFKSPIISTLNVFYYDAEGGVIDSFLITSNSTFTTPSNAKYIWFELLAYGSTTYNNDICINISDEDKNGTYEPYTEFRRDLPTDLFDGGMKSAGTVYDEVYRDEAKNKYIKVTRIGKVDLGSLGWSFRNNSFETYNVSNASIVTKYSDARRIRGICAKYMYDTATGGWGAEMTDKTFALGTSWTSTVRFRDDSFNGDASAFKEAMQGVMLYYELAEPIIEEIDIPYMDYEVSNDGTEQVISDTPTTPIKARVVYNFDAVGTIRQNRFDVSTLKIKTDNLAKGIGVSGHWVLDGLKIGTYAVRHEGNTKLTLGSADVFNYRLQVGDNSIEVTALTEAELDEIMTNAWG